MNNLKTKSFLAIAILSCCFGLLSAHAQSCTTLFPSGEAAPGGYGASWNPFSNARELLLTGTCNGDTVAVTIGSDQPNQYVFNQSFHWNGTEWRQIPLQGSSAPVGNWLPRQGKGSFNKGNQNPAIFVGYVCQYSGNAWRCGCADQACSAPRWQVQALQTQTGGGGGGGRGPVASGAQCSGATPPPGAKEAGLTKLVFCEDFSDPSRIDFDNKPVAGKTTFVAMRPGNIFGATTESKSDFTFTSEGTLQSRSKAGNYQADFISTWPTGGGNHAGFDTGAKPFYTEIRMKHNQWSGSSGFFAFWAMDTCHLYKTGCSQFYEPDFYEFISRMHVNAFHWWSSSMQKQDSSCINTKSDGTGPEGKDTQFNVYGARFTNGSADYYYNDKANIKGACSNKAWSKNIPVGPQPGKTGKYPIIFGTGPNQSYEADWVRVWQAP